jgi:hypothetical protein
MSNLVVCQEVIFKQLKEEIEKRQTLIEPSSFKKKIGLGKNYLIKSSTLVLE